MSDDRHRRWGRLAVVPVDGGFRVASEEDPEDWVVGFDLSAAFSARDWAERMVATHNLRVEVEDGEVGSRARAAAGAPADLDPAAQPRDQQGPAAVQVEDAALAAEPAPNSSRSST